MKKFINLTLLMTCLVMLTTTSILAQDIVRNSTNCTFLVRVAYGPVGPGCAATGFADATVPANTQVNVGIPAGTEIKYAKGAYTLLGGGLACPFYIGLPCSPYPLAVGVLCSTPCGDYKARLYPGLGIHLYD